MTGVLGPLPASDPPFMRRVRAHQAWYRVAVLGVDRHGSLAVSGAPCGSVLPDDAAARNLNFLGGDSVERYQRRRRMGWGVDPVRCTKYLTSSQTLSFNMLAQAVGRPEECAALFNHLLGRQDLEILESSVFEFAAQGTRYSLGDKTLLDLLLRFRTSAGSCQFVGVETKLADRFSARRTSAMGGSSYRRLAAERGLWLDLGDALAGSHTRQMTRCHALTESVQAHEDPSHHAVLLVLTHPYDRSGLAHASDYTRCVALQDAVVHRSWDDYLSLAEAAGSLDAVQAGELARRYVDLEWSEAAWRELTQSSGAAAEGDEPNGAE